MAIARILVASERELLLHQHLDRILCGIIHVCRKVVRSLVDDVISLHRMPAGNP
jgi:hypothetical protein